MRSPLPIFLLCALLAVACSDEGGRDGSLDTGVPADSGSRADTGIRDSGVRADSGLVDAQSMDGTPSPGDGGDADSEPVDAIDDAGPSDSGSADSGDPDADVDAGDPDAGAPSCGNLIKPCIDQDDCGDPNLYYCGPQALCVPMPDCGGVVGALCPPARPECLYYTGADFGPCFTLMERTCICTSSTTAALFQGC